MDNVDWSILACPQCSGKIVKSNIGAECASCKAIYAFTKEKQIDFRLQKQKFVNTPFVLTPSFNFDKSMFCSLKDFSNRFFEPRSNGGLLLDLGCGKADKKNKFEKLGFQYIGLDYDSKEADYLGDAHSLPFKNESFDAIYTRAVFEHLQYPFVAMNECFRVLKHKGSLMGSVAFLEPFHGNSFYHFTHYGLFNCLRNSGFEVVQISPDTKWDVLTAQAEMALFPKMSRHVSNALVFPLRVIHKAHWKIGGFFNSEANENTRLFLTAGSFLFIASKL